MSNLPCRSHVRQGRQRCLQTSEHFIQHRSSRSCSSRRGAYFFAAVLAVLPACYGSPDSLASDPIVPHQLIAFVQRESSNSSERHVVSSEDHHGSKSEELHGSSSHRDRHSSGGIPGGGSDAGGLSGAATPHNQPLVIASSTPASANIEVKIAPSSSDVLANGPPVFVGTRTTADGEKRWTQMMTWLPALVHAINGSLHRVTCDDLHAAHNETAARTECHKRIALGALEYWAGGEGTYLDLEDSVAPSQRSNYGLISEAATWLVSHPEYLFVHVARLPVPSALIAPEFSFETPFHKVNGGPIFVKAFGTLELADTMLGHTNFARRLVDNGSFPLIAAYDEQLSELSTAVLYPAVLQRRAPSELPGFTGEMRYLQEVGFTPWVYTAMDFVNVHAGWMTCCGLPVIVVACITNDVIITLATFISAGLLGWASGYR